MVRKVDVGHYSAHCQEDLSDCIKAFRKNGFNEDAALVEAMAHVIKTAPKFAMNVGDMLDAARAQHFFGMPSEFHLPYPALVIETPAFYDPSIDPNHTTADKTIAIAQQSESEGVIVTCVSRVFAQGEWRWVPGRSCAKLTAASPDGEPICYLGVDGALRHARSTDDEHSIPGLVMRVSEALHETGRVYDLTHPRSKADRLSAMYQDILMEAQAVAVLLWSLEQRHATVERHSPPAKLNKKREARGAIPFDEYHVLTLEVRPAHVPVNSGMKFPDRMSPREHQRAGHWRHYKSGARVWIKDMIINEGIGGAVWKDYRVRK